MSLSNAWLDRTVIVFDRSPVEKEARSSAETDGASGTNSQSTNARRSSRPIGGGTPDSPRKEGDAVESEAEDGDTIVFAFNGRLRRPDGCPLDCPSTVSRAA